MVGRGEGAVTEDSLGLCSFRVAFWLGGCDEDAIGSIANVFYGMEHGIGMTMIEKRFRSVILCRTLGWVMRVLSQAQGQRLHMGSAGRFPSNVYVYCDNKGAVACLFART